MVSMRSLTIALALIFLQGAVLARDAARDLRRLVGFTIMKADYVSEVIEGRNGGKLLKLSDGTVWKVVDSLMITPITMTDVIILGKKFPGLPEGKDLVLKILVDNEVFDVSPVEI